MKVYKRNVIDNLRDLASYEFQSVAWFENDQGLSSSFADDVEAVFVDTGLEAALTNSQIVFGTLTDRVLRELNEMVDAIGYKRQAAELINSSEMQLVRQKAAQVLALVEASDGKGSTVEIIW